MAEAKTTRTDQKGAMCGPSIVGFGIRTYKYASGRTRQWPVVAFSPRTADLTLYVSARQASNPPHITQAKRPHVVRHSPSRC